MCDAPGFSFPRGHGGHVPAFAGYDCSLRNCSAGDDPNTAGVTEQQALTCNGTSGSFTITFRQQTTASVAFDDTLAELEWYLEELTSVGNVTVSGAGSTVCDGNSAWGERAGVRRGGSCPGAHQRSSSHHGAV